jgi:hypothetical protein
MLKRLAIFLYTVALVSFYAYAQGDKAKQSSEGQSPSPPTSTALIQQDNGAPLQAKNEQHVNADVKIIALPRKDWQDVATFSISFVLAAVGIAGVWIGICTLRFLRSQTIHIRRQADMAQRQARLISRQVHQMEHQTKILKDSVAASQKSADAAMAGMEMTRAKERAELRIEFGEPTMVFDTEKGGYPIHYRVDLYGTTRAYIFQSSALAYLARQAREQKNFSSYLPAPRYFTPDVGPFDDYILLRKSEGWPEVESDLGEVDLIRMPYPSIFVDGHIWYRDVFGEEWMLEFDRVWIPNARISPDMAGGMWAPYSSGEHDRLRKVEYPKQHEAENPS